MNRNLSPEKVAALQADYFTIYTKLLDLGISPADPDYNTALPDTIGCIAQNLHGVKAMKYSGRYKATLGLGSQTTLARVAVIQDTLLQNEIPLNKAKRAIILLDRYICHHIDEEKLNDALSNLVLVSSSHLHGTLHGKDEESVNAILVHERELLRAALARIA